MSPGILGKKIGMTQVFRPDGQVVPVTLLKAGPCAVVQRKTPATDGYDAVQLGLLEFVKPKRINKPATGHLKKAGTDVSDRFEVPVVAFTGDTSGDWVALPGAEDALRAKLLIMECTFVDDAVTVEDAVAFGHTHINQIIAHAERFQNDAILLTHFSARYKREDIMRNLHARLPPHLLRRVTPLLEGFA